MEQIERLRQRLLNARQLSERMLTDFKTPQQWTRQVAPGVNHALWFVGHMANSDNFFISLLDPARTREMPEIHRLFGTGSQPVDDPALYPQPEEVLAVMRERREVLLALLDSLRDADLVRKTPEGTPSFLADVAAVFETAIWHEGVHTGQLSIARRAIGGNPVM